MKTKTQKTGYWEYSKNLISPENFCPFAFIICISDIVCPQEALLQKFTSLRNCLFFTLSSITPPQTNQKQTQNKILTFSVSFFYVTKFVPEKCE